LARRGGLIRLGRENEAPRRRRAKELAMFDLIRLDRLIELWFDEDVAHYDLTAQIMVAPDATARFVMNAREELVLAGLPVAERVFRRLDPSVAFTPAAADGDRLGAGAVLATVEGRAQALLTAERIALNIVQRLSGVATETARYVAEVAHTKAQVVDTRKTTPGLRMLEKYAVTCGGARNHRLALDNGIMLKDNHIAVAGSIAAAVARAKERAPILTRIEVECDRLDQVREALDAGADVIMLDNMDAADDARGGGHGRRAGSAGMLGRGAARHHPREGRDRGGFHLGRADDAVGALRGHRARRGLTPGLTGEPLRAARSVCMRRLAKRVPAKHRAPLPSPALDSRNGQGPRRRRAPR
jgi:nicotinate-nucleotide pyrophosphorylase (carboxylating)